MREFWKEKDIMPSSTLPKGITGTKPGRKLKICVIGSTYPRYQEDSQVPWLRETVDRLVNAGHEVTVLAPSYKGLKSHTIDGVPVHRFRYAPQSLETLTHEQGAPNRIRNKFFELLAIPYILCGMLAAARLSWTRQFDVINVNWPFPHGFMAWAGQLFCKAEVVATCHGAELALARNRKWVRWILAQFLKSARHITCNSSHTAQQIERVCGRQAEIIPYGTTVEVKRAKVHHTQTPIILFSGRHVQRKGVEYLLKAMPHILGKTSARLLITGDGDCRTKWEALSHELKLDDWVEFLGVVSNERLAELYRECDVYCLPAIHDDRGDTEGLGVVLIEALMHQRPVVSTSVGGIVDIIKDGKTGLLVAEKDEVALANAIVRLIQDRVLARRLGKAGLKYAQWHFDWNRITEAFESAFLRACA